MIGAARYDRYELNSLTASSSGDRLSPKVTVGVTPLAGFTPYVSYAEGYRAPAITETLIAGSHATGGGPNLFICADGRGGLFCFLPNPNLRPEVGKTKEVGVNIREYDGIFTPGRPRAVGKCKPLPQRRRRTSSTSSRPRPTSRAAGLPPGRFSRNLPVPEHRRTRGSRALECEVHLRRRALVRRPGGPPACRGENKIDTGVGRCAT